jgi:hypothetical protein
MLADFKTNLRYWPIPFAMLLVVGVPAIGW